MLSIAHTKQLTGATISGDYWDLDELNQAIYKVIGPEGKYYDWQGPRMRVLGVCAEIRHALQGERNVDFIANGLTKDVMKEYDIVAPQKNIYFSCDILWPELLFTTIALNDFVRLYGRDNPFQVVDVNVTAIRKFQAAVAEALSSVAAENEMKSFLQMMSSFQTNVQEYAIQYVDMLNIKYIDMSLEERQKNLGPIALKLAIQDKDYTAFRQQVIDAASKTKQEIHEFALVADYPEEFEW